MGNTAKQCRLVRFQDSDFAGDLEDSKSTSGGKLFVFGSHTFVPISWMCKKQNSVSVRNCRVCVVSLGLCFGVVFPETFMSTITFGSSIAVWFMKKVSSFIGTV